MLLTQLVLLQLTHTQAGRNAKPAARNFTGNVRLILTFAIISLMAYLCAEGPYETRETYWIWAIEAFYRCWMERLPDVPYQYPCDDVIRVVSTYLQELGSSDRSFRS